MPKSKSNPGVSYTLKKGTFSDVYILHSLVTDFPFPAFASIFVPFILSILLIKVLFPTPAPPIAIAFI